MRRVMLAVLVILGSFFATLTFWAGLFVYAFSDIPIANDYLKNKFVVVTADTAEQYYFELGKLAANGVILNVQDVWEFQGDFYSSVIGMLIGIIGVFGVLAFMYIKGASYEKIEEAAAGAASIEARKAVKNTMLYDVEFKSVIEDSYEDIRRYIEEDSASLSDIGDLKKRILIIEEHISKSDMADAEGSELVLDEAE